MATDSLVRRTVLENGVTVLTEAMPQARTAAFAVLQLLGSRDEADGEAGLTHFLEHFLFRGTRARPGGAGRSEFDIAVATDLLGGELEALTTREGTCYMAEVAADLLPQAVELVTDIVARPLLPADQVDRERSVIREEMRSFEDDPLDVASELSAALAWPGHPLGRPIEGTEESLASFTVAGITDFWRRRHVGGNLLACATGRLDHDDVVRAVDAGMGALPGGRPARGPAAVPPSRGCHVERRDWLEQAQVLLALPALPAGDPAGPALSVLAAALGGGMSSRLWQRVRETEGLAYDVSLAATAYRDAGRLTFHAATSPENVVRVLEIFHAETAATCADGPTAEEFDRARASLRAGMILGLESPAERLADLAYGEIVYGRHLTLDDHLARLDAVTRPQVIELARRVLRDRARSLVVLGPDDTPEVGEAALGPS